jgi:hypothetical protein
MAVDHVEVALVDRQVHGLADRAAGMVQARAHIRELYEIVEILEFRVAPAVVQIAHEWRAVGRNQHRAIAANSDTARGVTCMLYEFLRCRCLDDGTAEAARKTHALAIDIGAGVAPQVQCARELAELDADLFEHRIRVVLDQLQCFLIDYLEVRNLAVDPRGNLCG